MARLTSLDNWHDYWRADGEKRPFFHPSDAGLPVIALSAMGTTDILGAGKGCLVPSDDVVAFGQTLAHFLAHRPVWGHLQREAREFAREWSDAAMAERLASLYRELRRTHRAASLERLAIGGI